MKLYATLENSDGKIVKLGSNEYIEATVYDGNKKAYSVVIEWTNLGDSEEPTMGAIVMTREWRNKKDSERKMKGNKQQGEKLCPKYGETVLPDENGNCSLCGEHSA